MKKSSFFWLSIVLTFLLYQLPISMSPLVLLSTVAHEMGHGLCALLLGCRLESLQIHADGSGLAVYRGSVGGFSQALIAAAGLAGPAAAGCIGFLAARRTGTARLMLAISAVACALTLIFLVRNPFAILYMAATTLVLGGLAARANARFVQFGLVFLAVQLSLSVFSRADYLFTKMLPVGPSDTQAMALAIGLPYWFWGLVCGGASLLLLALGASVFLRDRKEF